MTEIILGISCYYHDSAAALIIGDKIVSAAQEERFTRIKHDSSFPVNAIKFCFEYSGVEVHDLTKIVYYENPWLKLKRILKTGTPGFLWKALPEQLFNKLWVKRTIRKKLGHNGKIEYSEHHLSHAASAFYPSPFESAAILTVDSVGEFTAATYGIGKGKDIEILEEMYYPHSVGLLYSAFTYFLGFKVNDAEYKVMGLAPYGSNSTTYLIYKEFILSEIVEIKDNGFIELNLDYFDFLSGRCMINEKKFEKLFLKKRESETELTQRHKNIARAIQEVLEDIMLAMTNYLYEKTKQKNLCIAGGVGLNCVANSRILKESKFENVWVQPAAGDAGGALGAALLGSSKKKIEHRDYYLGPDYNNIYIENFLRFKDVVKEAVNYKKFITDREKLIASWLEDGNVIGLFQGRMEFGPRALGNRSIIADARSPSMQSKVNQKIKFRESFRPFAPSVLEDKAREWFYRDIESPYMLFTAECDTYTLPAVTHVDKSSRLHTVKREDNPKYYRIIEEFYKLTGVPVILNTSFNVRGEPIVCSPEDAYNCFMNTDMDILVLEDFVVFKDGI